jgi:aminodeoxyfutalosine synthase
MFMKMNERLLDQASQGKRLDANQLKELYYEAPLAALGAAADAVKRLNSGNRVFYNRNFHIEPTNICRYHCHFCSYRRDVGDPEAWDYSIEQMLEQVKIRSKSGATEVHIVGGVHPEHSLDFYIELIRQIHQLLPNVAIKAFTAIELAYMIKASGISLKMGLEKLIAAGMSAIPGGGAEIFNDEIRRKICGEKGSAEEWLEVHEMAHRLGLKTNATILYGHIESIDDRIDHLLRLRMLQDRTNGFSAFIPLKYRSRHNSMAQIGEVSIVEDMKMMAISRLALDNFPHIKAYWPMFGKTTAEIALGFGADDVDGTIDDSTKIYSMAGAEDQKPSITITEIEQMAAAHGYTAIERDTFYNEIIR